MPVITQVAQTIYLHCIDPRCAGIVEEPVDGVAVETSHTFMERGGDIPGVENSQVTAVPANPADIACPECEHPREASLKPRPQYQRLSGHDPMGLLKSRGFGDQQPQARPDSRVEALEQQIAELRDLIANKDEAA